MALDKKFWAEYFEVYDVLNELIPYQELMQDIIDALDVKKGELIIDAGSGTGNLSMRMEDVGARVVAVDFSEEGQRIHKKKNPIQT
ncbi:MAG: class I SAM-dependent methyltransferase, partial [Candidatus Paceibacterota bacterium]